LKRLILLAIFISICTPHVSASYPQGFEYTVFSNSELIVAGVVTHIDRVEINGVTYDSIIIVAVEKWLKGEGPSEEIRIHRQGIGGLTGSADILEPFEEGEVVILCLRKASMGFYDIVSGEMGVKRVTKTEISLPLRFGNENPVWIRSLEVWSIIIIGVLGVLINQITTRSRKPSLDK
jgi:hypothetical protein